MGFVVEAGQALEIPENGRDRNHEKGGSVIPYLILIATSIMVGLVAVLLYRRRDNLDPKVFLAGALLN